MGHKITIIATSVAIGLGAAPAAANGIDDVPALTIEPSSPWNLNYADDSCRLSRMFGTGEQRIALYLERYRPSDTFMLVTAGSPLESRARNKVKFRFGPIEGGDWREYDAEVGNLGEFEPAVIMSTTSLVAPENGREQSSFRTDFDPEADAEEDLIRRITPETEAAIEWLDLHHGKAKPVRLRLGSMAEPMAGLRQCTDELLTHWGIDVAAHKMLTRPVVPASNPGKWLSSADYPTKLLRKGQQGIVKFRLSVDADGKATQCHIQKSTRPQEFDDAVCSALMRRAEFEPALGQDGKPLASYWHSTVRFQI